MGAVHLFRTALLVLKQRHRAWVLKQKRPRLKEKHNGLGADNDRSRSHWKLGREARRSAPRVADNTGPGKSGRAKGSVGILRIEFAEADETLQQFIGGVLPYVRASEARVRQLAGDIAGREQG